MAPQPLLVIVVASSLAVGLLLSEAAPAKGKIRLSFILWAVRYNEFKLGYHYRILCKVEYPKDASRGNISITKRRYIGQQAKFRGAVRFSYRYKVRPAYLYNDGSVVQYGYAVAFYGCILVDADRFPDDAVKCYLPNVNYNRRSLVKCPDNKCTTLALYMKDPNWRIANITTRKFTFGKNHYYLFPKVLLKRRASRYWMRVILPLSVMSVAMIGQLLVPITRSDRLPISVLVGLGIQLVAIAISSTPVIEIYGGGAIIGNLVTMVMALNAAFFIWSIVALLMLQVLSATPLSCTVVAILDRVMDLCSGFLLIPTQLVQREESKTFSRRSDWFKLVLVIDRVAMVLGIVVVAIGFKLFFVAA